EASLALESEEQHLLLPLPLLLWRVVAFGRLRSRPRLLLRRASPTVKLKRYDNMQWSFSTKLNSAQR
ncbi:Protein of unknown function, partial [Gryllus bimaculatus]